MPYKNRRNNGYSRIPIGIRVKLVKLIVKDKMTYVQAAKTLHIKLSTSKLIVKYFKENGALFDPAQRQYISWEAAEKQLQEHQRRATPPEVIPIKVEDSEVIQPAVPPQNMFSDPPHLPISMVPQYMPFNWSFYPYTWEHYRY